MALSASIRENDTRYLRNILVACMDEPWLMFKLINNSVCDRDRHTCRLQDVGDKVTCGT